MFQLLVEPSGVARKVELLLALNYILLKGHLVRLTWQENTALCDTLSASSIQPEVAAPCTCNTEVCASTRVFVLLLSRWVTVHESVFLMEECSGGAQSCRLNELCPHDLLKQPPACSLRHRLSQHLSVSHFNFKRTSTETLSLSSLVSLAAPLCTEFNWIHSVWQRQKTRESLQERQRSREKSWFFVLRSTCCENFT